LASGARLKPVRQKHSASWHRDQTGQLALTVDQSNEDLRQALERIELENRLSPGEQKINSLTGAGTKDARQNKNKESIWTKDPMVQ
jgi:hypothetical protein